MMAAAANQKLMMPLAESIKKGAQEADPVEGHSTDQNQQNQSHCRRDQTADDGEGSAASPRAASPPPAGNDRRCKSPEDMTMETVCSVNWTILIA